MLLICLSGLCLSCSAAPFDPVATANNWVGSLSAHVDAIKKFEYVKPMTIEELIVKDAPLIADTITVTTKPLAVAMPVVKAVDNKPVATATAVDKAATSTKVKVDAVPTTIVKAATPVTKFRKVDVQSVAVVNAGTPVTKPIAVDVQPLAIVTPDVQPTISVFNPKAVDVQPVIQAVTPIPKPKTIAIQPVAVLKPVVQAATFVVNPKAVDVQPVVVLTPVVQAATPVSNPKTVDILPVAVLKPVVQAATYVVKPKAFDVQPVAVVMPDVQAATSVVKSKAFELQPVAVATPIVKAAAVAVSSPVNVAEAPEPMDAPNPPMPSLDAPFVGGKFHAQDEMGQYAFGHYGGPNTRVETRDYLGRVTGSFSYINPEGDVHVRKYAAAPGMGFKVAGSDIPVDTPEVASVKLTHEEAIALAMSASSS
ncbi:unnamed protein product [Meganyctiphanes norvegica]|uniref:Cuticle protein n=1 Tax=Meganyctiphanes norvegica TaxID=48144 RepID=A0AAV2QZM8_MEGNR